MGKLQHLAYFTIAVAVALSSYYAVVMPVWVPAVLNLPDVVQKELANGKDANAPGLLWLSPLHWASRLGHIEVMQVLLADKGIEVNAHNYMGLAPLSYAAYTGTKEACQLLLSTPSVSVDGDRDQAGFYKDRGEIVMAPIHMAALYNNLGCLDVMLEDERVDLNARNTYNATALHLAIFHGHIDVVKRLLAHPRVNHFPLSRYDRSVVAWAAIYDQLDIMRLLAVQCKQEKKHTCFSQEDSKKRSIASFANEFASADLVAFVADQLYVEAQLTQTHED